MRGTTSRVAVVESINIPTTSSITFTMSRRIIGSVEMDRMVRVKSCGSCSIVRIQPNRAAAETMMRIAAVLFTVSNSAKRSRGQLMPP